MSKTLFVSILTLTAMIVAGCNPFDPARELTNITYTLTDVAKHATGDDCWIAIEGGVYDVTEFVTSKSHPGGDAILQGCGKDATELFNTRPSGSNTPHSEAARELLATYKIGNLAP